MKKIALFALALCMVGTNFAWGGMCDAGKVYHKYDDDSDVWMYTICFDTGEHAPRGDISSVVSAIKSDAKGEIVLLSSTDRQGEDNGYDNQALSERRVSYVQNALSTGGVTQTIRPFTAGPSTAYFAAAGGDQPAYRSVMIFYRSKERDNPAPAIDPAWKKVSADFSIDIDVSATRVSGSNPAARVAQVVADIDSLRANLDVSKWKDKNGNFNTSRLLSDSIAGVVLGTAGGLITSNVIKKNQVSGGFDDIHCTIGGQVVADWGDEFVVGMR